MTLTKYNKSTLQRIKQAYLQWQRRTDADTIHTAYKTPSDSKRRVWYWWKYVWSKDHNGQKMRVLSAGCQYFSMGLIATVARKKCFVWATGQNIYIVSLKELATI